jgi:hypothetical protein
MIVGHGNRYLVVSRPHTCILCVRVLRGREEVVVRRRTQDVDISGANIPIRLYSGRFPVGMHCKCNNNMKVHVRVARRGSGCNNKYVVKRHASYNYTDMLQFGGAEHYMHHTALRTYL